MKYLVTGAAGFIGSHVVEMLLAAGDQVIAIDSFDETLRPRDSRRRWWEDHSKTDGLTLLEIDLTKDDLSQLLEGIDIVIHEAATPGLAPSWVKFDKYLRNNVLGTQLLAQAIMESDVQRVVHASTSSVYGITALGDEDTQPMPISPYGTSKLASELIWHSYRPELPCDVSILRYFSVFGPRQREDMAWSIFIARLMQGQTIQVTGDGTQSRTNTYVSDAAAAALAASSPESVPGTYNICGDVPVSVNEALEMIAHELGVVPEIERVAKRAGDQAETRGNNSKAKRDLVFSNSVSLEEGIRRQIDWAKRHPYW